MSNRPGRRHPPAAPPLRRRVKAAPARNHGRPERSGRHTATPGAPAPSPGWYPIAIIALLIIGVVVIMASYWGLRSSGSSEVAGLGIGAALVLAGLAAATRYH